ncbi:YihY/virulence factor BrkB family protein [Massilia sp. CCM 9210]|uniref:YihY/virulence factor BrkB family protein n=1 Tax=Massilia scottii TaxID=3057166 RepID=UPI002796B577|nr:YihY/virulence factor BrkB family protein [Massilia sp. CCM 9210]MDQ1813214.1 YihY/virulence factor BrkB family protein [Massilia sp. CCM 9210]
MKGSKGLRLRILNRRANAYVLGHPLAFAWQTLKGFKANQGLLLAGAVAYYALLSIVPFLMLVVVALSHFIDQAELLSTLARYLEWLVPGQSNAIVKELSHFMDDRDLVTWVLFASMLFFSSLAFTALENAMSVIFHHRVAIRRRHFLISAILPYCYILALGAGIMIVTLVAGTLQVMGEESVWFLGYEWSLNGVSGVLLYCLGLTGEILVLSSIYLVMPVGRLSLSHALIGGVTAALLWEIARHVLVWYFSTLSQVNMVYGSMTTAIVVMFSLEIGATLLLFGAQVISEYERAGRNEQHKEPIPMTTRPAQ